MQIDNQIEYNIDNYRFRNFVQLGIEEKTMILNWRNSNEIRQWMSNTNIIMLEDHLKYIDSLNNRNDRFYWLVYKENEPIGVVDMMNIDYETATAETGYYLNPELLSSGLGFEFYYYFKLFFHDILNIENTVGLLKVGNINSYMLITYFGGHVEKVVNAENDDTFLSMVTTKEDFDKVKDGSNDIMRFVRYIKENKRLDWSKIIKNKI